MEKVKRTARVIVLFLGFLFIPLLVYIFSVLVINSRLYASIFGVSDGGAWAKAWVDKNSNGVIDEGEPPLPGVCIKSAVSPENIVENYIQECTFSQFETTDENGQWMMFMPGRGSCEDVYVLAKPPLGYQPSTDIFSDGCTAQFGFVERTNPETLGLMSVEDFARQEIFFLWAKWVILGVILLSAAGISTYLLEKKALA